MRRSAGRAVHEHGGQAGPGTKAPARSGRPPDIDLTDGASTITVSDVSGQSIVGNDNLQLSMENVSGGTFHIGHQLRVRPRPWPIAVLPRKAPDLIGRDAAIDGAVASVATATPVQFWGPSGIGKTAVLKHLAHRASRPDDLTHGVAYLAPGKSPLDDVLQSIFDLFFDSDGQYRPSDGRLRQDLRDKRALILVDDLGRPDDLEALLDAAPECTFVVASEERAFLGEHGRTVELEGLPEHEALALVGRVLQRPIHPDEVPALHDLWDLYQGSPASLLRAAQTVKASGGRVPFAQVLQADRGKRLADPDGVVLTGLSSAELSVLALLGSVPAAFSLEHIAGIAQVADEHGVLTALEGRGLVEAVPPGYRLAAGVGRSLEESGFSAHRLAWQRRAFDHLLGWAYQHRPSPQRLAEGLEAMEALSEAAARAGEPGVALVMDQVIEPQLVLSRRWGAWGLLLQRALAASRALGDRRAEAWALHESGNRAHLLGDHRSGQSALFAALQLRESIGDLAGAAVTSHNLALLQPLSHPDSDQQSDPGDPGDVPSPGTGGGSPAPAVAAPAIAKAVPLLKILVPLVLVSGLAVAVTDAFRPDPVQRVTIEPAEIDFGDQEVGFPAEPRVITMTNSGNERVAIGAVSLEGADAGRFDISEDGCSGQSLEVDGLCLLAVTFTADVEGRRSAEVAISREGGEDLLTVAVAGAGSFADIDGAWRTDRFIVDQIDGVIDRDRPLEQWSVSREPSCVRRPCRYQVVATVPGLSRYTVELTPTSGGGYRGTVTGRMADCVEADPPHDVVFEDWSNVESTYTIQPIGFETRSGQRMATEFEVERTDDHRAVDASRSSTCRATSSATYKSVLTRL